MGFQVGARWLREWCNRAGGVNDASGDDSLVLAVCRVVLGNLSGDEAAAELFDLFGDGAFEDIQELLEHRCFPATTPLVRTLAFTFQ
jgi:hypothetical protein